MQLADLKTGMIVITRNNNVFYVLRDFLNGPSMKNLIWNRGDWLFFDHYNDDLTCHVDYDEDDCLCQKDPTPTEIRNSRRRARYYAKAHDIVKVCIPTRRETFLTYVPDATKVLWTSDDVDNRDTLLMRIQGDQDKTYLRKDKSFSFPAFNRNERATLSDLRTGMLVTLRNGNQYIVMRNMCDAEFRCEDILWSKRGCISLSSYNANMNYASETTPCDHLQVSADAVQQVSESTGSPYDIVEVYLSLCLADFYKKRGGGGEILWRNEPAAITYRRYILDVPPCHYNEVPYPLYPENSRPIWMSEEEWNRILAAGLD